MAKAINIATAASVEPTTTDLLGRRCFAAIIALAAMTCCPKVTLAKSSAGEINLPSLLIFILATPHIASGQIETAMAITTWKGLPILHAKIAPNHVLKRQ